VISVVSCRTKDGAPGPAGESSLMQQGFISGTITYTGNNGNVSVPFNYQYFESLSDNKFFYYDLQGEYYEILVKRRDQKDDYNDIHFELSGYSNAGVESDPTGQTMYFNLITLVNNELVVFNGYSPTITNVNLDPATGRLTFDYTGTVNSNNGSGTVTGKVDVILNRSPKNVIEPQE
jgi:hypothetical protein